MHTTLLVTDVLEHICELADPVTLSVMAQTARVLHEPAIYVLWRVLPDLLPLLQCFPTDCWAFEGDTFKFTRILRPKDWTVFLKYASLVRHFVNGNFYEPPWALRSRHADAAAWEAMCCLRPTATLFPQLRSFRWGEIELPIRCLSSFLICTGPHLFRVGLTFFEHPAGNVTDEMQSSFDIMAERFPMLRALDTLRSVNVRLDDAPWPSRSPTSNVDGPIPSSLERLELFSSPQAYVAFSMAVTLHHAITLVLWIEYRRPNHLIGDYFRSIRAQCSTDTLKDINIQEFLSLGNDAADEAIILPAHLRPLLDLRRLERVFIDIPGRKALDDGFCSDMAKAWPHLKHFYIGGIGTLTGRDVSPTVRALPPFAVHCPKLETFGLDFDAKLWEDEASFNADDSREEIYGLLAERASTSLVSSIYVGDSPILVPEYIAAFLARIFPCLKEIKETSFFDRELQARWNTATRLLPLFKRIRNDERLRLTQDLSTTGAPGDSEVAVTR
ncbi:uncharacterized protein TRAVEDRAFT_46629 [Trametes versicolor FP-101664 SS1]|uniref:uncharacterized protein n=1 Tax=Trametes versicolor (strain FP-101664) TaxID=717944 RepID=UPI0004621690|nr:uncharacterized protein TRAVEDRAFT_46629 [Trametes versicolor FP-101664 SS1]EIW59324.1 hypothetical protein TRAVEDRAFT_46629 [Trametes versicolor FP-101664 SS1]